MAISTLILGIIFIIIGLGVGYMAYKTPEKMTKLQLLTAKWGTVGKIIYYIGYVMFPISLGAVFIWAASLGVDLKTIFFS